MSPSARVTATCGGCGDAFLVDASLAGRSAVHTDCGHRALIPLELGADPADAAYWLATVEGSLEGPVTARTIAAWAAHGLLSPQTRVSLCAEGLGSPLAQAGAHMWPEGADSAHRATSVEWVVARTGVPDDVAVRALEATRWDPAAASGLIVHVPDPAWFSGAEGATAPGAYLARGWRQRSASLWLPWGLAVGLHLLSSKHARIRALGAWVTASGVEFALPLLLFVWLQWVIWRAWWAA